ncbi:MAG: hypothetical protein LBC04_02955 [Holosporaceae bacterium]|jgi:hypothetical protein|nr:hypothetical protein [Holosporaceae bacterium]
MMGSWESTTASWNNTDEGKELLKAYAYHDSMGEWENTEGEALTTAYREAKNAYGDAFMSMASVAGVRCIRGCI